MRSFLITARLVLLLAAVSAFGAAPGATAGWSRADADALYTKLVQIAMNGMAQRPAARRTTVLEREVNAYIAVHAKDELPAGVIEPVVTILRDGRLRGRATVDLDALRDSHDRGTLSAWTVLRGRVPVEAIGVLRTAKGVGAFSLESATVSGIQVPKTVLQELVTYYSRSDAQPNGIDIEAPFRLPARIREIRTMQGEALVLQ